MKEKRNWKFSRDPEMRLKIAKYAEMHGLDEAAEKYNLGRITVYLMTREYFGSKRQKKK